MKNKAATFIQVLSVCLPRIPLRVSLFFFFFFLRSRENKTSYTHNLEGRYVGVFDGKANQDRINRTPRVGA